MENLIGGDFGGLRQYKSYELEVKKHANGIYYGGYLKHTIKTVYSEKGIVAGYISISKDRNFKGNGLAGGASAGMETTITKRFNIDVNIQVGYGRFYKMTEEFQNNLPSANFLDMRVASWIGFRL